MDLENITNMIDLISYRHNAMTCTGKMEYLYLNHWG